MRLEISCDNKVGITQKLLDIFNEYHIELRGLEIDDSGRIFLDFPTIEFEDFQVLMPQIRRVEGVKDVRTTPFMPTQQARCQLQTLLQCLPDPVFSIDANGKIIFYNNAVGKSLEMTHVQINALSIDDIVDGFNFSKWVNTSKAPLVTQGVQFIHQDYTAEILPVSIPENGENIFAGAVIILKSEQKTNTKIELYQQIDSGKFDNFDANSNAMKRLLLEAQRMSELDGNILITGDTGTGKELIARACHENSRNSAGKLVTLNCASLPDDAAEMELFGYVANTQKDTKAKDGLFSQASNGTILLKEVSQLSMSVQAKLLHVLEHGTYHQIGDDKEKNVECRVICTSCKDLAGSVQEGQFREDLFYRLNVLNLVVPSLRERKSDIVPLANKLLQEHAVTLGIRTPRLSKPSIDYINSYPWPGNIQQLKNALYRAISLIDGSEITKESIVVPNYSVKVTYIDENFDGTLEQEVKRFERDMLKSLYPSYPSTRQLARKLGLSHTAIANKLREYGISKLTAKLQ